MALEMDVKRLEMSICESMTKVDVMTLMMEHAILFLLNLLMEKTNNQKNGADTSCYGSVQDYCYKEYPYQRLSPCPQT